MIMNTRARHAASVMAARVSAPRWLFGRVLRAGRLSPGTIDPEAKMTKDEG